MVKPSTITQWLQQPAKFTAEDRKMNAALLKAYPYFVPSRFMESSELHKKQSFAPPMMTMMQLFMGNWLLFYSFLQSVPHERQDSGDEPKAGEPQAEREVYDHKDDPDTFLATYEDELSVEEDFDLDEEDQRILYGETELEEFESEADAMFKSQAEKGANSGEALAADQQDEEMFELEYPIGLLKESPLAATELERSDKEPDEQVLIPNLEIESEQTADEWKSPDIAAIDLPMPGIEASVIQDEEAAADEAWTNNKAAALVSGEDNHIAADLELNNTETKTELPPQRSEASQAPTKPRVPAHPKREDQLIQPIFTEDYFLHQGFQISDRIGEAPTDLRDVTDKSLMVVMTFTEWLNYFKAKKERAKQEEEEQRALKTMWQKEKLAAALEEENDEIPENVFEMAVNSIAHEEGLASESLAEILVKQGKYEKAIEMYRKLSLRTPQKKAYFAGRIEQISKLKQ